MLFVFPVISQHQDGTCSWNRTTLKTRNRLSCVINIMVTADDESTLLQVQVGFRQATSHNMSQC